MNQDVADVLGDVLFVCADALVNGTRCVRRVPGGAFFASVALVARVTTRVSAPAT